MQHQMEIVNHMMADTDTETDNDTDKTAPCADRPTSPTELATFRYPFSFPCPCPSPFPYMFVSLSLPLARHTNCCVNEGNKENNNDKIKDTTAIVVVEREKRKTFAALAHKKNVDDVHHMRGDGGREEGWQRRGYEVVWVKQRAHIGDSRIPCARKEAKNRVCLCSL